MNIDPSNEELAEIVLSYLRHHGIPATEVRTIHDDYGVSFDVDLDIGAVRALDDTKDDDEEEEEET